MTEQAQPPYQPVVERIRDELRVELSPYAEGYLMRVFDIDPEELERGGGYYRFDEASQELAMRLPDLLRAYREQFGVPLDREVGPEELSFALRSICPLWPFC